MVNTISSSGLIGLLLFGAFTLASADVGVVVEFPNGTVYSDCVEVSDGSNAYQILKATDLDLDWSNDGAFGRALCMINGVGSDVAGDGCSDWTSYWAFSLALDSDSDWTTHSPVGFTAGPCWNRDYSTPSYDGHYCAVNGDVLGFHYTDDFPSGYPEFEEYEDICKTEEDEKGPRNKRMLMSSRPYWRMYAKACGIEFTDLIPPQNLVKLCDEKKAMDLKNRNLTLENSTNKTLLEEFRLNNTNKTLNSSKTIKWDYNPKVITSFEDPFTVRFYSDDGPVPGITVRVNNQYLFTNEDGEISFKISSGDYEISFQDNVFGEFKKIFRIGG